MPRAYDPDASLETVDLDADEEEAAAESVGAANALDAFLGDVPGASPLPKDDDVTVHDDDDDDDSSLDDDGDRLAVPQQDEVSRAESTYYTPSDTLEDIASALKDNGKIPQD